MPTLTSDGQSSPSQPLAVPSKRQLAWHRLETYAFVHFGPNTFSGAEWGTGTESRDLFHPTDLDCGQWVRTFREAGLKGVIFTAKHHDGFCLWPSAFSTHTVAHGSFRRDVVRELADVCAAEAFPLGIYVSPWDRNHPDYGTERYNDVFAAMLEELVTGYGPLFEVWFDGANGEGPTGRTQTYDWPRFVEIVRRHQPNAVVFSDAGPDVRWVGNEQGLAGEPCWATVDLNRYLPGTDRYAELTFGQAGGPHWVPAECDVSIRPGWFWRESETDQVKSPEILAELFETSVGRGASLLLNVPPDPRGRIPETDVETLLSFGRWREDTYGTSVSQGATLVPLESGRAWELRLGHPAAFDRVSLRENIGTGQRILRYQLEAEVEGEWAPLASGQSIGARRIHAVGLTKASRVRLTVVESYPQPDLASMSLHLKAPFVPQSVARRHGNGAS